MVTVQGVHKGDGALHLTTDSGPTPVTRCGRTLRPNSWCAIHRTSTEYAARAVVVNRGPTMAGVCSRCRAKALAP